MPIVSRTTVATYASFTALATTYRVATSDGVRAANKFDGLLVQSIALGAEFPEFGILQGRRYQLQIAADAGSAYRTLVQNNVLDGIPIALEVVTTVFYNDGTSAEQSFAQTLTISGTDLKPGMVVLNVVDIEDTKLNQVYPSATYTTTDFPNMDPDGVGKPVAFPVGTGLKFPGILLAQQTMHDGTNRVPEWLYGLSELEWQSFPITAVNTGAPRFVIAGDQTAIFAAGDSIWVFDPASRGNAVNAGKYTISAVVYAAPDTRIFTNEAIASATVSSSINLPPRVLAVYRDGRLVAPVEYTIEVLDNAAGPVPTANSDFSNGSGEWIASTGGTGTATVAAGIATITGDGGATNFGFVRLAGGIGASVCPRRHQYVAQRATITGTGQIWFHAWQTGLPVAGTGALVSAGAPAKVLLKCPSATGDMRVSFGTFSTRVAANVTVDNWQFDTPAKPLLMVRFAKEQRDYSGKLYAIEADVFGFRSRLAPDEIKRLLTLVGTANAASFTTASAYGVTHKMLVDCAHGARGQRKLRAIIEDLLFIARGGLMRNSANEYAIVQDTTGASVSSYVESAGDLIEVQSFARAPKPLSVAINYKPSPIDPSELLHKQQRLVSGGTLGDQTPRDCEYLRDHEAADRLACYLGLREQYNGKLSALVLLARPAIASVYTITSANTYAGALPWFVSSVQHTPLGTNLQALEYNAAVHTYGANPLPPDAQQGYQPDYSQTAPLAPTALVITAGSTDTAADGTVTARITVEAVPPVVNYTEVWFVAIHNVTAEIGALVRGDYSVATGKASTILTGLRPGEVYKINAYAVNGFNVQGVFQTTFNATAIGGGGAVTSATMPGATATPGTVASCTATQRMGRIIEVSWPAVTTADVWGYILERQVSAGGYSELWRGQATTYRDANVAIGTAYQYRVKARDTRGNVSAAYATSGSVTPVGNISGGTSGNDIGSNTVGTSNRTAVSTSTGTVTFNTAVHYLTLFFSHGLGKQPFAHAYITGSSGIGFWISLNTLDATNVNAQVSRILNQTDLGGTGFNTGTNSVAAFPHTHDVGNHRHFFFLDATGSESANWAIDFW